MFRGRTRHGPFGIMIFVPEAADDGHGATAGLGTVLREGGRIGVMSRGRLSIRQDTRA